MVVLKQTATLKDRTVLIQTYNKTGKLYKSLFIYFGAKCEIILLQQSVPDHEINLGFSASVQLCKEIRNIFKFYDPQINFAKTLNT